jgi:outer membrane murein-binding lipoprotein Lpp
MPCPRSKRDSETPGAATFAALRAPIAPLALDGAGRLAQSLLSSRQKRDSARGIARDGPQREDIIMRDRMRDRRVWLVVVGLLIGAVAMSGWSGEAKTKKPRKLRAEIAQLRATVAQLQSDLDFQRRRDAAEGPSGTVVPGGGGGFWPGGICGDPCATDSDEDGTGDCEDPCPCDPRNTDGDADGSPDCIDPCPDDATDACIDPCRMDSDGDGVTDCEDPCPWDPTEAVDGDEDGVADCQDPCPGDPTNDCFSPCPLLDQDGDGTRDCNDPCPWGEATGMPCVWKGGDGGARRAGTR